MEWVKVRKGYRPNMRQHVKCILLCHQT